MISDSIWPDVTSWKWRWDVMEANGEFWALMIHDVRPISDTIVVSHVFIQVEAGASGTLDLIYWGKGEQDPVPGNGAVRAPDPRPSRKLE